MECNTCPVDWLHSVENKRSMRTMNKIWFQTPWKESIMLLRQQVLLVCRICIVCQYWCGCVIILRYSSHVSLTSPPTRLFVQQIVQVNNKRNIAGIMGVLWGDSIGPSIDSPHKRPVKIRKVFRCDESAWWELDSGWRKVSLTLH